LDEEIRIINPEPKTIISVGITWIDGRALFKPDTKWSKAYYGVCHYSREVFLLTPLDFIKPTMITTIGVADDGSYCERSDCCLNFTCKLNRFTKEGFTKMFKDCGTFSLGMPLGIADRKPLWFNVGKYKNFWGKLLISPNGGTIKYDPNRGNNIIKG
jgi:hypothetical protein